MLTWDFILQRVKEELGMPNQPIEKTDNEMVDYLKRNALKKFSKYFPNKNTITVDFADTTIKDANRPYEILIVDPDNRQVLNVSQFIPNIGSALVLGHPAIGAFSYNSIPELALQTFVANNTAPFSHFNYTIEFKAPNRLAISPIYTGKAVIEYERALHEELEDILPDLEDDFTELCLAMLFVHIGRLRTRFTNLATPFGEIPINGESLLSEGQAKYDQLIEKFESRSLPNIIFDKG